MINTKTLTYSFDDGDDFNYKVDIDDCVDVIADVLADELYSPTKFDLSADEVKPIMKKTLMLYANYFDKDDFISGWDDTLKEHFEEEAREQWEDENAERKDKYRNSGMSDKDFI